MNPKTAREAEAEEFGKKLRGFGINLIVKDILASVNFLRDVLQMKVHRANQDFAVVQSGRTYFQLHADHTYHSNPIPSLLPKEGARGAGVELRLYQIDPDEYNGATLLGINGISIKSHGNANPYAFSCALNKCYDFILNDLNKKIIDNFKS